MKKTYITPEMEVKTFNAEEIMTSSAVAPLVYSEGDATKVGEVSYNDLFAL